ARRAREVGPDIAVGLRFGDTSREPVEHRVHGLHLEHIAVAKWQPCRLELRVEELVVGFEREAIAAEVAEHHHGPRTHLDRSPRPSRALEEARSVMRRLVLEYCTNSVVVVAVLQSCGRHDDIGVTDTLVLRARTTDGELMIVFDAVTEVLGQPPV